MPYDDEELRREALMRMAMPEMQAEPVSALDDEIYEKNLKDRFNRDIGDLQGQMGYPTWEEYKKANPPSQYPAETPMPKKSKGFLDSAAGAIYDILPGAPGTKATLDPLLKRKGLGR
jgi:hypothetical protein